MFKNMFNFTTSGFKLKNIILFVLIFTIFSRQQIDAARIIKRDIQTKSSDDYQSELYRKLLKTFLQLHYLEELEDAAAANNKDDSNFQSREIKTIGVLNRARNQHANDLLNYIK